MNEEQQNHQRLTALTSDLLLTCTGGQSYDSPLVQTVTSYKKCFSRNHLLSLQQSTFTDQCDVTNKRIEQHVLHLVFSCVCVCVVAMVCESSRRPAEAAGVTAAPRAANRLWECILM